MTSWSHSSSSALPSCPSTTGCVCAAVGVHATNHAPAIRRSSDRRRARRAPPGAPSPEILPSASASNIANRYFISPSSAAVISSSTTPASASISSSLKTTLRRATSSSSRVMVMAATGFVFVDDEDVVEPKDGARCGSGRHEQKLAAEGGGPDAVEEDAVFALSRLETLPMQMDIWTTQMDWPRWNQLMPRGRWRSAPLQTDRYKRLNSFCLETSTAWMMFCVTIVVTLRRRYACRSSWRIVMPICMPCCRRTVSS
jgi:hypothetical protein